MKMMLKIQKFLQYVIFVLSLVQLLQDFLFNVKFLKLFYWTYSGQIIAVTTS